MLGLIVPLTVAVLLGVVFGGAFSRWSAVRVRWAPLAATCLFAQVALFTPPLDTLPAIMASGPWLYLLTLAGVLAVLLANARLANASLLPLTLAALGVALNVVVIVANGGYMPRSDDAAAALGMLPTAQLRGERLVNVASIGDQTRLAWLGDVIAQPRWLPLANVVSVGDLLLAGGLAWWAFVVTRAADGLSARGREGTAGGDALVSSTK
jgi:hypothetical protein